MAQYRTQDLSDQGNKRVSWTNSGVSEPFCIYTVAVAGDLGQHVSLSAEEARNPAVFILQNLPIAQELP